MSFSGFVVQGIKGVTAHHASSGKTVKTVTTELF